MLSCFHCASPLDPAMSECPACGAEVEVSRLTGILGSVCRNCDAFNEPGTAACVSCGAALGARSPAPVLSPTPVPGPAPEPGAEEVPRELPPLDFEAVLVEDPDFERPTTPHPIELLDPVPDPAVPGGRLPVPDLPPLPFESVALEPAVLAPAADASGDPAPAGAARFELVVERGDDREGAALPLGDAELTVGDAGASLAFPGDPGLAPRHASFTVREGRAWVRDGGGAGGTFLCLRGLSVPLRPGDAFALGDRLLRYDGPLPAPSPPAPDGTRRLGSPRPPGQVVVLEERLDGGRAGRVWLRAGPSLTLGRAGCSVNLGDDPWLSQAHAEILIEADGTARLRDLGSANGTFVRLPPRAERELRDGDRVRLGRQVLRVTER